MFAWSGLDDVAFDGSTIERNLADAALLAIGVLYGNVELCVTENALHTVFFQRVGNTGVNLNTIIGRLDTKDILCDGNPVPLPYL